MGYYKIMVTQITRGIKISVLTSFEGTYFKNYKIHFAFSYEITIENHSKDSVQLMSRHWEIFDSLNDKEIVDGEGVIGKKPVLKPTVITILFVSDSIINLQFAR